MSKENKSEIIIFKTSDNTVSIDVRFEGETVWLTIDDMVSLFERSRSTINEHILNIFEEGELDKESSVKKSEFPIFLPNQLITIILNRQNQLLSLRWFRTSFIMR